MVPGSSRKKTIDALHEAHSKGEAMYKTARENIWWPTMKQDLMKKAKDCIA